MDFEVYCDESHGDLLASRKPEVKYLVIGSLWIEAGQRQDLKSAIHMLREKHKIGGEFKWHKVSARDYRFYADLLDLFTEKGDQLRFRCIAVDPSKVDLKRYHNGDAELGFFKFYYQMLNRWIRANNDYKVFCDYKLKSKRKLKALESFLQRANLWSTVKQVQAVHSKESVLIQFADVLTGLAAAKLNNAFNDSSPKGKLIAHLEDGLGTTIEPTYSSETKFNVFVIRPGGGW
ncbi:MAG: DUF3800 domain-containing protein [Candidatus Obscuribacter sp.]|nr:DUF3800 domain-containing protein [Candidatus Obscuribacter sp.]